jgi:hypothetical protein
MKHSKSGGDEARAKEVLMNGTIYFRADHELVGRVLAEKLRRRMERSGVGDSVRIARPTGRSLGGATA